MDYASTSHLSKAQRFVLATKVFLWVLVVPIFSLVAGLLKLWPFGFLIRYQGRIFDGYYYPKSTIVVVMGIYFIFSVPVYLAAKYFIVKKVK